VAASITASLSQRSELFAKHSSPMTLDSLRIPVQSCEKARMIFNVSRRIHPIARDIAPTGKHRYVRDSSLLFKLMQNCTICFISFVEKHMSGIHKRLSNLRHNAHKEEDNTVLGLDFLF
jgi:hypothetical protein